MDTSGKRFERSYEEWHNESNELESTIESTLNETGSNNNTERENKNECISTVNRILLYSKLFYFCYSSAMGALWPYLPLYFRQLFLTPRQVGAIVASRTLTQFLFVPFWCTIAEKYRRHKELLLVSLFAWLLSTISILLIPQEQPKACLNMYESGDGSKSEKIWFDFTPFKETHNFFATTKRDTRDIKEVFDDYSPSMLNTSADFATIYAEYDPEKHLSDSSRPFILLLLITIIGVSLASPAQSLADIYTIKLLKSQTQSFGQQAVWAAVGSAMFAFIVGSLVSFMKTNNPCTKKTDVDYSLCFYVFGIFMTSTILVAANFKYNTDSRTPIDLDESIANLWECVKTINDVHIASLLIVAFYCGFGNGFISTFLFWHLREMGGLQILLALVTLINSTAEVFFYILSDRLLRCIGHFRLIYIGLLFFSIRFLYYSFLRQPWLVLPIEVTHGLTSAAIRSAMISYVRQEGVTVNILHGIFNGIHGGLGFSVGGLVGGLMVHNYGHSITFLIFGEISLLTLLCFVLVNNIWPYTKHDLKKHEQKQNKNASADFYAFSHSFLDMK